MIILRWLDDNAEKTVILVCYLSMTGIIFVEVIRRFAFGQQAPWSSTIPIYLFLWVPGSAAPIPPRNAATCASKSSGRGCPMSDSSAP